MDRIALFRLVTVTDICPVAVDVKTQDVFTTKPLGSVVHHRTVYLGEDWQRMHAPCWLSHRTTATDQTQNQGVLFDA